MAAERLFAAEDVVGTARQAASECPSAVLELLNITLNQKT